MNIENLLLPGPQSRNFDAVFVTCVLGIGVFKHVWLFWSNLVLMYENQSKCAMKLKKQNQIDLGLHTVQLIGVLLTDLCSWVTTRPSDPHSFSQKEGQIYWLGQK
jgi:hypothetical protein